MTAEEFKSLILPINAIKFLGFKRYKMGTALGIAINDGLKNLNWSKSFKSLLFGCILSDFDFEISGNGKLVFLITPSAIHNKAYLNYFEKFAPFMPDNKVITTYRKKTSLDFSKILSLFFYPIWFFQMRTVPLSIKQKLNLIGRIASCKKWEYMMPRKIIDKSTSLCTTFCDSHMYDNITAQYCRLNSIPTATLQHGIYQLDAGNIGLAFKLFVSDKILVWGSDTEKIVLRRGIDPKRIYIAGPISLPKKLPQIPETPVFGVMLSGGIPYADEINNQLIMLANTLARKIGFKYAVRSHPGLKFPEHLRHEEFLSYACSAETPLYDMASNLQFFLCVSTSTIAYELLNMGAIVFVHENSHKNYFHSSIEKLCFKTIEELESLLTWAKENNAEYRQVSYDIIQPLYAADTFDKYYSFFERYLK